LFGKVKFLRFSGIHKLFYH